MDLTITISPNACESPMTEEDCGVAADAAGKSRGGCGYDFVGAVSAATPFASSFDPKDAAAQYGAGRGCYTYPTGTYSTCAYWSSSGDPAGEPSGSRQRICTGGAVSTPGTSTVAAGDPMTWNYDRESRSQCSVCLLF